MAQNLILGKGLMGNFQGPETMYTPLFSLIIAAVELIVKQPELAAHLVSLVAGVSLIIPVFLIAEHIYGRSVAYLSALLLAFHPMFIALAGSIYNENLYLPLLLAGIFCGLRALESDNRHDYVLLSAFLSLAYLTRPEAFVYPFFFAAAVWVNCGLGRISIRKALFRSLLVVGIFLIIASPYVAFLYRHTGHVRFEGKWNINYTIARRELSGMSYEESAYGLGPNSSIQGPLLDPFHFAAYTPYAHSLADKVSTLLGMAKHNSKSVERSFLNHDLGSPLFLLLIPIGLFRTSWDRRRLFHESIITSVFLSVLFLWLTSSSAEFRYVFPLVPLGILWVAKGIEELAHWSAESCISLDLVKWGSRGRARLLVESVVLLSIFGISLRSISQDWLFHSEEKENLDIKAASLWLKNLNPGSKRIASFATIPTYYAQGTLVGLPYAPSGLALHYLADQKIDYIVLDAQFGGNFPEVSEWLKDRIPDARAKLIYESSTGPGHEIAIYHWDKELRAN